MLLEALTKARQSLFIGPLLKDLRLNLFATLKTSQNQCVGKMALYDLDSCSNNWSNYAR